MFLLSFLRPFFATKNFSHAKQPVIASVSSLESTYGDQRKNAEFPNANVFEIVCLNKIKQTVFANFFWQKLQSFFSFGQGGRSSSCDRKGLRGRRKDGKRQTVGSSYFTWHRVARISPFSKWIPVRKTEDRSKVSNHKNSKIPSLYETCSRKQKISLQAY